MATIRLRAERWGEPSTFGSKLPGAACYAPATRLFIPGLAHADHPRDEQHKEP